MIADEPERVPLRPQAALQTAAKSPALAAPNVPNADNGGVPNKPAPDTRKPARPAFEQGQLVIFWKDRGQAALGKQVLDVEFKLKPSAENVLNHLGGVLVTFKLPNHADAIKLKAQLQARFPDWQMDFNSHYRPQGEDSAATTRPRQYVLQKIGLAAADNSSARPLHIGMVDTNVATDGALRGMHIERRSFLGLADRPAPPRHGTALAALMAGADERNGFRGLAPGIKLFAAAIMRQQGEESGTTTEMLVRALDWLLGEGVRVINLSLGGSGDAVMESAIQKVLARNVVIVAAAGNFGPEAGPSYPAAYPGVIAVTASDALDRVMPNANQGHYITLTAPGVDVWAPDAGGGRYHTGTSFSAAIVTGAIALLLSEQTQLSGQAVTAQLCSQARDLGIPGRDPVFGCGLLQLPETTLRSAKARG